MKFGMSPNKKTMETTVKQRLEEFIRRKKIPVREFERRCGLTHGYLANLRKSPGLGILDNILTAFPELNREWLLYGKGEMIVNPATPVDQDENHLVPLLPLAAQGGKLTDFQASIEAWQCERVISPIQGVDFAITVSGDSMTPEYPSGSRILIKRIDETAFLEWGRVYVLDTCNGVVIKQLMPGDDNRHVRCVSLNPAYPAFDVDLSNVHGVYRVLMMLANK